MEGNMQRYFGIGWNRTGTTSMKYAFDILGVRAAHWKEAGKYVQPMANARNYEGIIKFIQKRKYQMYCDSPFYQEPVIHKLDEAFPGSKLIMTMRDPDKWVHSLKGLWGELRRKPSFKKKPGFIDIFKCDRITGNESHFREIYVARNERVLSYFQNRPEDLFIIDMEKGDLGWPKLCELLGTPIPDEPFPHKSETRGPK